jgi:transcriptional regulator with XRE-family HTH domain
MEGSFGARLTQFREEYTRLSATDFAEKIKTKQQYISNWEGGRSKPNATNLKLIETAYPELNIDWLFTGNQPMIKGTIKHVEPSIEDTNKHYGQLKNTARQLENKLYIAENRTESDYAKENIELRKEIAELKEIIYKLKEEIILTETSLEFYKKQYRDGK